MRTHPSAPPLRPSAFQLRPTTTTPSSSAPSSLCRLAVRSYAARVVPSLSRGWPCVRVAAAELWWVHLWFRFALDRVGLGRSPWSPASTGPASVVQSVALLYAIAPVRAALLVTSLAPPLRGRRFQLCGLGTVPAKALGPFA